MKNLLLLSLLALALSTGLSGCNTASNMGHEVSGWFNTDRARGAKTLGAGQQAQPPAPAPAAAPVTMVESAPLQNGGPVKVALLLPLSGDKAGLGKSFLDAAQIAVMDVGGKGFDLLPKDTKSDAATAQQAAREAVAAGAQMIIGPVFATSVPAVREAAPSIPVLSLSNDGSVAGGNVYVMGFDPAEQVQRIAEFARERGVQNVAVLVPASAYGELVESALHRSSLNLVTVQKYQKNRDSINQAVSAVAAQSAAIDGIIIPDGGAALAGIAEALFKNKITAKKMPLFGTGLWDDQNLSQSVALIGGFYPAADPAARNGFMERFQRSNGYAPVRLSTLAYDATALAAALAAQGQGFHSGTIENGNGFKGLDGLFRFDGNKAVRGLAVLEVTSRGPRVVSPAAERF